MKSLSAIERMIIESIGRKKTNFEEIKRDVGLADNICFNVLQALILRGLIKTDGFHYLTSDKIPLPVIEKINNNESKQEEALEIIEAIIHQPQNPSKILKIAMDSRDEKIFMAMLYNLESFLRDAHKKSAEEIELKKRKIVFWGISDVQSTMNQIVNGIAS